MTRFLVVLLIGASLLLLAGCATGAKMVNMTPANLSVTSQHPYSVSTAVSGGEDTSALAQSKISDEAFRGALEAAIRDSRVFSGVVSIDGADYHLQVVITNLGQPVAGFNMTVTITTHWKLTQRGSSQPIWQDFIATKHTATVGDQVLGVERLRLANEGAARKNIEEGIRRLSALSL